MDATEEHSGDVGTSKELLGDGDKNEEPMQVDTAHGNFYPLLLPALSNLRCKN